jgi:hypothetical protein
MLRYHQSPRRPGGVGWERDVGERCGREIWERDVEERCGRVYRMVYGMVYGMGYGMGYGMVYGIGCAHLAVEFGVGRLSWHPVGVSTLGTGSSYTHHGSVGPHVLTE